MTTLPSALGEWRALLGAESVLTPDQTTARYGSGQGRRIAAALRPTQAPSVQRIVQIAARHRVPLYPISTGRNWGYGGANPPQDDCVVLDLSLLNRILAVDAELGTATLEPGVTQGQLRAHLDRLGLPFYVADLERPFARLIEAFAADYARGLTPNPCVVCNHDLKFGELLRLADDLGCARVATGHYARLDGGRLRRGVDAGKDQSYLLAGLEDARRHRANLIMFFATIAIVSVIVPILGGLVDAPALLRLVILLPVMALAVPLGARLFHVVPDRLYRPFAMGVLLVSGGFTFFTERLRARLNLDSAHANTLEIEDGVLTGRVLGDILDADAKAAHLRDFARTHSASTEQIIAMGDGANDLKMLANAGFPVAYHAKPLVRQQTRYALNVSGLDGVLNWFES